MIPADEVWFKPRKGFHIPAKFRYNKPLFSYIKTFPGSKWVPSLKHWLIPVECVDYVKDWCRRAGLKVIEQQELPSLTPPPPVEEVENTPLYPFQKRAARRIIKDRRHVLTFEMGTGKTPTSIFSAKIVDAQQILIVCPATARPVWFDELEKWWPEVIDDVALVTTRAEASSPVSEARIRITSYSLLQYLEVSTPPDMIIMDEFHALQSPTAMRTRAAVKLSRQYPDSYFIGLTGTLFADRPDQAWQPLDVVYPGRCGTKGTWRWKYMNVLQNDAGYPVYSGADKRHVEELKMRLDAMTTRVTKREAAPWLPPFLPQVLETTPKQRLQHSMDQTVDLLNSGTQHACLLTWKRDEAKKLATMLSKQRYEVFLITGELTPEARAKRLKAAKESLQGVVVATIDSTAVAIDLTFCTGVVYADIVDNGKVMLQSLGRFHRLSSVEPVTVYIMAPGFSDPKYRRMKDKIEVVTQVLKAGSAEDGMQNALAKIGPKTFTAEEQEEILSALQTDSFFDMFLED